MEIIKYFQKTWRIRRKINPIISFQDAIIIIFFCENMRIGVHIIISYVPSNKSIFLFFQQIAPFVRWWLVGRPPRSITTAGHVIY